MEGARRRDTEVPPCGGACHPRGLKPGTTNGLVGGAGPLAAGALLDAAHSLNGRIWIFHLDSYAPLFLSGETLLAVGMFLLSRLFQARGAADSVPATCHQAGG